MFAFFSLEMLIMKYIYLFIFLINVYGNVGISDTKFGIQNQI